LTAINSPIRRGRQIDDAIARPGACDLLRERSHRPREHKLIRSSANVRWLIAIGVVRVLIGLFWLSKVGLGRLPGDIVIERGSFRLYFPIVTCLILSGVLSFILRLLNC
jgi:hypothetical protein